MIQTKQPRLGQTVGGVRHDQTDHHYLRNTLNAQNAFNHLTFTMFQPRLKSGGVGVVEKFGRGTVYEVIEVAVAAL